MSELWPVGTWVADVSNHGPIKGGAYCVDEIDARAGMGLIAYGACITIFRSGKEGFVEIPPKPDEEELKRQGYRLTGMAADCSKEGHGHLYVNWQYSWSILLDGVCANNNYYNGWRWLVERIEEEPSEEYKAGYEAGWAACRDRAIRILSSRKEHDYE